jgi:hypothetical protein
MSNWLTFLGGIITASITAGLLAFLFFPREERAKRAAEARRVAAEAEHLEAQADQVQTATWRALVGELMTRLRTLEIERERWAEDREQWDRDRARWEQERAQWQRDREQWDRDRARWEQDRERWAEDRAQWEREQEELLDGVLQLTQQLRCNDIDPVWPDDKAMEVLNQ